MSLRSWLGVLWLLLLTLPAARAQVPEGYPSDYAATVAAAKREGQVVVYAATDMRAARPLIDDFQALYPGIEVRYHDSSTIEVYERFLKENQAGASGADVLWSSAMDLQMKLVNDGHALAYASQERPRLPAWAVWKNEAYGTTLEPVGFAYSKSRLSAAEVPRTHADFIRLLEKEPARFNGRVATYDLENSGLGMLVATQDAKASNMLWDVGRVLGRIKVRQMTTTADMLDSIAAGDSLLAYNVLGAYAHEKLRTNPGIGFVYPGDYTLVGSRIAFIQKRAPHPNAARLWLDYLLSRRGQSVLAGRSGLFALRDDVRESFAASSMQIEAGGNLRPIGIGPSLIAYLDRNLRQKFLARWKDTLRGASAPGQAPSATDR